MSKAGVFFFIIVLVVIGIFINTSFFTAMNFMNIIQACAFLGIVCSGMGFITYAGKMVDMSAPITIAITGIVAVDTLPLGLPAALAIGMTVAVMIGLINGFVVGKFKANPIIWTLALNFVLDGMVRWMYLNRQIYPDTVAAATPEIATQFISISRIILFGIPLPVVFMIITIVIAQFILTKTKFGVQLKMIGSNEEVARFSGINVQGNIMKTYVLSSVAAGLAGIFITSFGKVGANYNGVGYEFKAITAIVIGGMSLAGGRGNMLHVLGGVFTISLLSNILTFLGIGTFVQSIITGSIFILIVLFNTKSLGRLGKDDV
jgi:ribose/xylose/arabinose/galactoside ABC-type transport system permease subunit